MLDYAPEGSAAPHAQEMSVVWQGAGIPGAGQFMQVIAASRAALRLAPSVFQPERLSGFCAT